MGKKNTFFLLFCSIFHGFHLRVLIWFEMATWLWWSFIIWWWCTSEIGVSQLGFSSARRPRGVGRSEIGEGGTVCWNGVLHWHFLGIKMQHWNKCSLLFYKFLKYLINPSQMDAWKKLKLPKVVKGASNLASFYRSHIDGIVCV